MVEVIVFWFFKRFSSYYWDSLSSEEEMSQFMRIYEIYDEVAKAPSIVFQPIFVCITLYNV